MQQVGKGMVYTWAVAPSESRKRPSESRKHEGATHNQHVFANLISPMLTHHVAMHLSSRHGHLALACIYAIQAYVGVAGDLGYRFLPDGPLQLRSILLLRVCPSPRCYRMYQCDYAVVSCAKLVRQFPWKCPLPCCPPPLISKQTYLATAVQVCVKHLADAAEKSIPSAPSLEEESFISPYLITKA